MYGLFQHFFGLIRGACGNGCHPDPLMFINVYRLLCTYSLVKPPRGSNVSGAEMLTALLSLEDIVGAENQSRRQEMEQKIELILDGGIPFDDIISDHEYLEHNIDRQALTVLGGYVSRKLRKMKPCSECDECFKAVCVPDGSDALDRELLLNIRSYGGYLKPSDELHNLLFQVIVYNLIN